MSKYLNQLRSQVKCGKNVFIAEGAYVLGDVTLSDQVSIWFNAIIRGDFDEIKIGEKTNVQEGVLMHVDHGVPMHIGRENTIGHGAMLHGCTIGDYNLIGIRATLLNGVKIGKGCIIGANSLVTEGTEIPDFSMVYGSPAKIVKTLDEDIIQKLQFSAEVYASEAARYLE